MKINWWLKRIFKIEIVNEFKQETVLIKDGSYYFNNGKDITKFIK